MIPTEDFYWNLTLRDGRVIPVPPPAVAKVKHWIASKEDFKFSTGTIAHSEYRSFDKSSRRYVAVPLLEQAAQAFKQPIITKTDDGTDAVSARWVKKQVTTQEFRSYYGKGHYRRLDEAAGMVTVAFVVATHLIDTSKVDYCTPDEVKRLGRSQ